jgi:hypothetical protein
MLNVESTAAAAGTRTFMSVSAYRLISSSLDRTEPPLRTRPVLFTSTRAFALQKVTQTTSTRNDHSFSPQDKTFNVHFTVKIEQFSTSLEHKQLPARLALGFFWI